MSNLHPCHSVWGRIASFNRFPTGFFVLNSAPRIAPMKPALVAVGMPVTRHPPHSPVLARLTHTVPALDVWRQSVRSDTGVGFRTQVARHRVALESVSTSSGSAGSVDVACVASLA